jgi:hypothetical protein
VRIFRKFGDSEGCTIVREGDYSTTLNVGLRRDRALENRNLQKMNVTDGSFGAYGDVEKSLLCP